MRRLYGALLFIIAMVFYLRFPGGAYATTVGPHIVNYDQYDVARSVISGSATATVYIDLDCVLNSECLNQRVGWVKNSNIGEPIFRIGARGTTDERAMSVVEAQNAGQAMSTALSGVYPNAMVIFGNEPNNITFGWSGGSPESYGAALRAFISSTSGLRVLPAALDPIFNSPGGFSADVFIQRIVASGGYGSISGLAFHAYQGDLDWNAACSPDAELETVRTSKCAWLAVLKEYRENGVNSDLLVLSEYSLHPTLAGDLSTVRNFLDDTKDDYDQFGLDFLTPLILNSCKGTGSPPDNWDWLLFINGNPSTIRHPGTGEDVTSKECDVTNLLKCAPLDQVAQNTPRFTLRGFLSRLISRITPAPPPRFNAVARYPVTAADQIANTDETDTPVGLPVREDLIYSISIANLRAPINETYSLWDRFFEKILNKPDTIAPTKDIKGYSTSTRAQNHQDSIGSVRNYLFGMTVDKVNMEKIIDYKNNEDPNKDTRTLPDQGAMAKLYPYKMVCPRDNIYKKREDCLREMTLDAVLCGYTNDPAVQARGVPVCTPQSPDYHAGYLSVVGGGTSTTAPTWISAKPTGESRPHYVVEFACMNDTYAVPDKLTPDHIRQICNVVMGEEHLSGKIAPDSVIGQKEQFDLKSCAEDCKYGPGGAWMYVPTHLNHETVAEVKRVFDTKEADPGDQDEPGMPIGIPGIKAAQMATEMVSHALLPKKVIDDSMPYNMTTVVCPQADANIGSAVDYTSTQELRGGTFTARVDNGEPPNQLGASTGDVLQAADPPAASTQPTYNWNSDRTGHIEYRMGETTGNLIHNASILAESLLPKSVGDALDLRVGDGGNGPKVKELGVGWDLSCSGGDYNCESEDVGIPGIGGPKLMVEPYEGLVPEAVLPYDPTDTSSTSRWLNELASKAKKVEGIALDPWKRLASLVLPEKEEVAIK